MKQIYWIVLAATLIAGTAIGIHHWNAANNSTSKTTFVKPPKRTRIDEAIRHRKEITKDPALGYVPHERMLDVYRRIQELQNTATQRNSALANAKWRDRGPYDVGGRTRAILIDKNDPTGNTVFAAGVTGGLWKTTNITAPEPTWQDIGHFYDNINISAIAQDPSNPNILYFGTGEPHGGAGRGLGIWKSTDGGDNWTQLPNTVNNTYHYVVRLFVHPNTSDVYAATQRGLQRSQDGGDTWVKVLGTGVPPGVSNAITDIEYGADGTIYISDGHNGGSAGNVYRSEPGAGQGDIGNWTRLSVSGSGFPGGITRIELAVAPSNPNVLYALTAVGSNAEGIYRSFNRGENWIKTSEPPSAVGMDNFTRGQAWYDLTIAVNPTDENDLIIGGIDLLRSNNAGSSWFQISQWFGGGFQYVHADQHEILWDRERPSRVFFGNDGGVYLSTNAGTNIFHKNTGYNVTQFYAMAMHPDALSNYFLAGSQDNGSQQFDGFDMDRTVEVLGGDGFTCHIDQDNPDYQIVSLYYGSYFFSQDGGLGFAPLRPSGPVGSGFYSPSDWDNEADIFYAQNSSNGSYFRWKLSDGAQNDGESVNVANLTSVVRCIYASDNTPNRIYIGSNLGRIRKIDNAHEGTSVVGIQIDVPTPADISSIVEANGDPDHLIATLSNYGTNSVWESTDGGATWTSIEGDLPDMPVNWAVFHPYDNDKLLLGTDAGVWVTEDIDGANTNWLISTKMPVVRTDMLQTRQSDGLIAAGTYGRGIFSTDFLSPTLARFAMNGVGYLNGDIGLRDRSINSQTWLWSFGDNTAPSNDELPTHTYDAIGTYDVTLTVNDTATTQRIIKILPDRPTPYTLDANTYGGDFESTMEDFGVDNVSGTPWELGESTVPAKAGTHSGSSAWVTGLTNSFYDDNSEAYLYTPNFDLSDDAIYELKFWARFNTQYGFDGMLVEYSLDRGSSWSQLGTYNEDLEGEANTWYNFTSTSDQTAFPQGSSYFTGYQADWREYKININDLMGQPDVAFRFVFKSNGLNRQAGVAIDDFEITKYEGALETVLREFDASFITPNGNDITIDWITLPEYRCKHFTISVSENGRDFQEYNVEIPAQGFSGDANSYNYSPRDMRRDLYYFQLKVVDFDDNFFMSDIAVVSRNDDDAPLDIGKLFPNPFGDQIELAFTKYIDQTMTISMYDAAGKLVISEQTVPNSVYANINTAKLQSGVYVLVIQVGEDQIVRKVIKD